MALDIKQSSFFDYASLDEPMRVFVQEKARGIHARLKRTAEDIIAIGQDLVAVKARLGHGQFQGWLQSEFEMSLRIAQNFMQVARKFGDKNANFAHLSVSVLYELASPSMPETVIEFVETKQIPATIPAIREAKREIAEEARGIPPQFFHESIPNFAQWQQDNVALGLDRYGDVPVEEKAIPEQEKRGQRDAHVMRVMGSSESPEWYTPQEVIDRVLVCFGEIDLDPCSNSHEQPAVPARMLYTREDNGLSQKWYGKVYLNPPYGGEIPDWTRKLVEEYERGGVTESIALLPGRIDTNWFQPLYEYAMCNVHGRLQFANSPYNSPFPAVIVYLGDHIGNFIDAFKGLGPIMRRIG